MDGLLASAKKCAKDAAEIVRESYGSQEFSEKADKSPVTETDHRVHRLLETALNETGIPVLSEEGLSVKHPYPDRLWIIDPIDGTTGFLKGTGDFAIMIGLLEYGRPVLGVVHLPASDMQYYAVKGEGAWKEEHGTIRALRVSDRRIPELIGVQSVNHSAPYMYGVSTALETVETIHIGGIGVKAGLVAEGRGDYFLTLGNLGEWDICAPEIILSEAGGRVTDRSGDPLEYGNAEHRIKNGAVFSNSACHREVLTALSLTLRPLQ